jgi:hypothetical protein
MINSLSSVLCRMFFAVAFILLIMAVWDRFIRMFGWTISWIGYEPGRMLEFAAILMIFVIALLLRQIREGLKNK